MFTALIQSSSAATGVVITMVGTGVLPLGMALFIVLGANIGTCVTALLACVGANANSKRVAFIHFTFNVIGTVIFSAIIWIFRNPIVDLLIALFPGTDTLSLQMRVSIFHVIFNVSTTLLLLPFVKRLVKLSKWIIKDKAEIGEEPTLKYADKRLLTTPTVALGQLTKETFRMADMAIENLNTAMKGFIARDTSVAEQVTLNNERIGKLDKEISDYLVQVSTASVSLANEKLVNALHHNLGDISRIADLSDNVVKYTRREVKDNLAFSEGINEKILAMHDLLRKQYDLVKKIILEKRYELMNESDALEDDIDASRKSLVAEHIQRLAQGKCRPENNTIFINLVSNLERIGDHLNFIAHSLDNV